MKQFAICYKLDTPTTFNGVDYHTDFLSHFVWGENTAQEAVSVRNAMPHHKGRTYYYTQASSEVFKD